MFYDALPTVLIQWNLQRDVAKDFFSTLHLQIVQAQRMTQSASCSLFVACLWLIGLLMFIICGHPQVSSVVKPFERSGFLSLCEVLHLWSLWDDWPYQTVKCWLYLGDQLIILSFNGLQYDQYVMPLCPTNGDWNARFAKAVAGRLADLSDEVRKAALEAWPCLKR